MIRMVIEQLFPPLFCFLENRKIKRKIDNTESEEVLSTDELDTIPIDSFRQEYSTTFDIKNKFEDKAKTNVIGITIAITLIMGAAGLVSTIANKYQLFVLNWIAYIVLIIAVLYLLYAGILAIKVLFSENTMCVADINDISENNVATKQRYRIYIQKNINRNLIRNNLVYSSFVCIRNAIICMMMLLVLVALPITNKNESSIIQLETTGSIISYESHISIPENTNIEIINRLIVQDLCSRDDEIKDDIFCFINTQENLLIKYKTNDSDVIVLEIISFDNIQTD